MPTSEFVRADPNNHLSTFMIDHQSNAWPPAYSYGTWAWTVWLGKSGPTYYSTITYLRFDTSSIPDDATITGAVLKVTPASGTVNGDGRNFLVDWHAPDSWDPTDPADFHQPLAGSAATVALSAFSIGVEKEITLSIPSNVSKVGYTVFALGISGGQPSAQNALNESVYTDTKLVVTYTFPCYASKVLGVLAAKVNGVVPAKVIGV